MPNMGEGVHVAKILSTMLGSSSNGAAQIIVRFENESHEHATWYGYFTAGALPYTLQKLRTCGWDAAANDNDVASLHGSDMLVGNKVELVLAPEEYAGKVRVKIQFINSLGMTEDEARKIGKSLKSAIACETNEGAPDLKDIPF